MHILCINPEKEIYSIYSGERKRPCR